MQAHAPNAAQNALIHAFARGNKQPRYFDIYSYTRTDWAAKRAQMCRFADDAFFAFSYALPLAQWEAIPGSYNLHYYFNPKTYVMQWYHPAGAVICKVIKIPRRTRSALSSTEYIYMLARIMCVNTAVS